MTTLTIAAAIPGFADNAHNWETSENDINFRSSPELAERCTVSFAACELRRFLPRTIGARMVRFTPLPMAAMPSTIWGACWLFISLPQL